MVSALMRIWNDNHKMRIGARGPKDLRATEVVNIIILEKSLTRIRYKLLHLMKMNVSLPCWMIGVVHPSSSLSIINVMNLSITDMSMSPR